MTGVLALYGSGEFTPAMSDVDLFVLGQTRSPNVLILPTAAGQESDHRKWIEDGIRHYVSLGIEAEGLDIATRKDADDEKLARECEKFSCFVFSGGDPGYLLKTLSASAVWKSILKLHELGAAIIGSSAGAMVMGAKVWSRVYDYNNKGTLYPWEPGLALIEFGVMPHYNVLRSGFSDEQRRKVHDNFPPGMRVVGIDEDTAYIRVKEEWVKKGKGKIHDPAVL